MTNARSGHGVRPWVIVARRILADRRPFATIIGEDVRLPDGQLITDFLRIELRPYVTVFAMLDAPDQPGGAVVPLVEQYRMGPRAVTLELPAGAINEGETPFQAAQRELREEAGLEADYWQSLGTFWMDANYQAGLGHIFLATSTHSIGDPNQAPDHGDLGDQTMRLVPLAEVRRMWRDGTISGAPPALAIALALQALDGSA